VEHHGVLKLESGSGSGTRLLCHPHIGFIVREWGLQSNQFASHQQHRKTSIHGCHRAIDVIIDIGISTTPHTRRYCGIMTSQVFLIGPWTWRCWSNCRSRRCGWSFSRPSERCPFTQANTCQALTREFEETVLLPACRETGVSILRTRCKTTFQVENRYESARVSLHPSMSDVPHVAMRDDLRLTSPFKLDVNDGILSNLSFQP
jgi:hypothetical protein